MHSTVLVYIKTTLCSTKAWREVIKLLVHLFCLWTDSRLILFSTLDFAHRRQILFSFNTLLLCTRENQLKKKKTINLWNTKNPHSDFYEPKQTSSNVLENFSRFWWCLHKNKKTHTHKQKLQSNLIRNFANDVVYFT